MPTKCDNNRTRPFLGLDTCWIIAQIGADWECQAAVHNLTTRRLSIKHVLTQTRGTEAIMSMISRDRGSLSLFRAVSQRITHPAEGARLKRLESSQGGLIEAI